MNSSLFRINLKDLLKGILVAFIAAVLTALMPILESGTLPTLADLKTIGIVGLTAAVAYLVKNFLTNSDAKILKPEGK